MNLSIEKTEKLQGTIKIPPSKSYTHRALIISALGPGTRITNPLFCEDTKATIEVLRKLGARIKVDKNSLQVKGFNGWPTLKDGSINAGESGTLLRFILSLIPYCRGTIKVEGQGSLLKRPNVPLISALQKLGVNIHGQGPQQTLPIQIETNGKIEGGEIGVSGEMSSQTISSLLIAGVLMEKGLVLKIKSKLVSRPYVDITLDVLHQADIRIVNQDYITFKIRPGQKFNLPPQYTVHGDYSSAAFLMVAGCLVPSEITLTDLVKDKQGDREIISILQKMGAKIKYRNNSVSIKEPFELKGIKINGQNTPDLVPILTVLGTFAQSSTTIYNIKHLIYKESNRLLAPVTELKKLGGKVELSSDRITVHHSTLHPGVVSSWNDHRIAMALAVAGLKVGGVTIQNTECIAKSYPDFVQDLKKLGAKILKK